MVKTLNNFDQLLKEVSMTKYDKDKKFDPKNATFTIFSGPESFEEDIKDSTPFPKLRQAYNDRKDVRCADFYGTDIMIRVFFADSMRKYSFGNAAYLSDRVNEYVEVAFPFEVLF